MARRILGKTFYLAMVSAAVAIAALAPSGSIGAEERLPDKTSALVSNWEEGDNRELTVKIGKQKDLYGRRTNEEISYDVAIKVAEEDREGYTIEWVYDNIAYSGNNPLVKKFYKTSEGLKIVYRTDRDGMFRELVNWKEVQERLFEAIDMIEQEFPESQAIKAMTGQFRAMYSSRESIESTLRDIQIYHLPYGGEYTLGEWTSTETNMPNYLGGYPFPAIVKTSMTEWDPVTNRCRIAATQTIDAERASGMIKELVRNTARGGQPLSEEQASRVNISDVFEYEVELAEGWVDKAYFKRESQTGAAKGVDTYEITLK